MNTLKSKCIFNEMEEMLTIINRHKYAVVKGEVLSLQAYNEVGKRTFNDIDFLIPKQDICLLEFWLSQYGWYITDNTRRNRIFKLSTSHQVSPWKKQVSPYCQAFIDINFDLFWGEYEGKRIDIDNFLSGAIEMDIYGVKVKTLPPLKAMIQLILHHYKDMNSIFLLSTRKSIKYNIFKDVYYLLKNNLASIPLDKLYIMSAQHEIIPYVFYILYYTGQVFDDEVLKEYIEAFRTPEGEILLNCYGLCTSERKEWKCDFKTRLEANNLFELIKNDLTDKDKEKIALNKLIFMVGKE